MEHLTLCCVYYCAISCFCVCVCVCVCMCACACMCEGGLGAGGEGDELHIKCEHTCNVRETALKEKLLSW